MTEQEAIKETRRLLNLRKVSIKDNPIEINENARQIKLTQKGKELILNLSLNHGGNRVTNTLR